MIIQEQLKKLSKEKKISEAIIYREYLQLLFLSEFYKVRTSRLVFFKGGTALHLILGADRFSEDLDFTIELEEDFFSNFIMEFFKKFSKIGNFQFKERKTLTGKRFLIVAKEDILPYKTFINLDFSFREKVLVPEKSIVKTDYPIIFSSFVYHPSKEEIFAEKIRAIFTRTKGRDLYDIWFLLNQGVKLDEKLVRKKMRYYNLEKIQKTDISKKIERFSKKDFILDLRPFVSIDKREHLGDLFDFVKEYLIQNL